MYKIFSIVVTYNGIQWIEKCLNSLNSSTIITQIAVIDNLSTDGTPDIIENQFPDVDLIRSKENLGFGKGNNIGLQKAIDANADYIFLLNQDAWIEKETIEKLIHIQKNNPGYGIISPLHLNYAGSELEYYFSTIINPVDCPGLVNGMYFNRFNDLYKIEYVHAACWLISGECLRDVGGFDPVFKHYGEDNDYINRAVTKGYEIGVCPAGKVYHAGTHEGLNTIRNFNIELNFIMIRLKNIKFRLRGLLLVHCKVSFDKMTSALLYRRFRDFGFQFRLFVKSIFLLRRIMKTRKICKTPLSYLNEN